MDSSKQSAGRLRLAKGFFETIKLHPRASEHEIRNSLSRCYYAFFHLSHVVLGRYRGHDAVAGEIEDVDERLGQFVANLQRLRIEADYIPEVIHREYGGELAAYRLRANQVLDEARTEFQRMLKLARRRLTRRRK